MHRPQSLGKKRRAAAPDLDAALLDRTQRLARVGSYARDPVTGELRWSDQLFRLFGYQPGEVTPSWDLALSHVHPDDRGRFVEAHREVSDRHETFDIEFRVVHPDGTTYHLRSRSDQSFDPAGRLVLQSGVIHDVTEQKQAEAALLEANRELRDVLDSLSDCIWSAEIHANSGVRYRYYSSMVEAITGRPAAFFEAGAENWISIVHPGDRDRFVAAVSSVSTETEEVIEDYRIVRPDGGVRWVRDRVRVQSRQPGVLQLHGVVTDITEQRKTEEAQRRLEEKIQHAQKLESLGVLAGGIAHDFNNLLTAITGHTEIALERLPLESESRGNLIGIQEAAKRAAELCGQMLAYSGRGRFVPSRMDLSQLVREMAEMISISTSKKARIDYDFAVDLPTIEADATQIRQIVVNFITNASEALEDGAGMISVRTGRISIGAETPYAGELDRELTEGVYAFIEVSDTGCGMDADTRARLFDPFFTTKFTGRGLGLSAVQGIVRGHGGAIEVRSRLGEGSTFRVLLPAAGPAEAAVEEAPPPERIWHGAGTVLLVDDEAMVLDVEAEVLELLGFQVITASDGLEAVRIFEERADEIDCVILDLTMPNMDGVQAFEALAAIRGEVPVILTSGYSEQEMTGRFEGRARPAGFLQKPVHITNLQNTMKAILNAQQ